MIFERKKYLNRVKRNRVKLILLTQIGHFLKTHSQNLIANVSNLSAWIVASLHRKYLTIWKTKSTLHHSLPFQ